MHRKSVSIPVWTRVEPNCAHRPRIGYADGLREARKGPLRGWNAGVTLATLGWADYSGVATPKMLRWLNFCPTAPKPPDALVPLSLCTRLYHGSLVGGQAAQEVGL